MIRKQIITIMMFVSCCALFAQHDTINISGNNTSSSYISYDNYISLPAGKITDVLMARYCYFSSTISGQGELNLYAGGERCYLGTAKGAQWPDWSSFSGDVHIYPFKKNSSSAGSYGVVLAHGGKSFSAENIEDGIRSGKVNSSMENNRVTLHSGAVISCEANTNGAGFRIGELQTEAGSTILGYMKKNTRAAYFLVGCLNTDATLAGTIAPPDYSDTHPVGIIKEGTGTYRITANSNYLTGALRVLQGRVLVMNDRAEAESKKLRGALGAKTSSDAAIAFVFGKGVLGGTGSIGGTVDNYGTIEPGEDTIGTLTLKNYTATKAANLYVHPASKLRFKIASAARADRLVVDGTVTYSNITEDFSTSDKMPLVQIVLDENASVQVGDEFVLMTAKGKSTNAGEWNFQLKRPAHYTWELQEKLEDGAFQLVLRLVSLEDQQGGEDDPDDDPDETGHMGAYYDDGIDDASDNTSLRAYAAKNGKWIGTAISTWKNDITNETLAETREAGTQFNMLVAENEMKFDDLQPNQGEYTYWGADNLVSFAQRHDMTVRGHCLAWHAQVPGWVSSDGKKNDKNWTRAQALKILEEHITNVVTHFKGQIAEWDVVNECLDDDQTTVRTNPDGYDLRKESVWTRAIGEDFIDSAFVYAHRADPDVKLYLNDYDVELQGKAKATAFYNLAVRLKQSGIPIDGVGLQCHFSVGDVDSVKLESTVRRFAEAGLKCIITELDMGIPSTSAENLEEQARNYRVVTDIVLNNDNCPNLVIWGLKDNNSWREASNPLLYTAELSRKPAWYAVRSALRHRTLSTEPVQLPGLSQNPDQFLGNITTTYGSDMDYDGFVFSNYWNQVTPENATKWGSVEGTRGTYNWWGADKAANYAKQKGFPFKFHTLVWGSQFPEWLRNLSAEERYKAIEKWMDAVKTHYPNLQLIDVVNEAIEGHQADTYLVREALGGEGETGYDWIVRAFEMAAERWPDAILIYNDFNSIQWDNDKFVDLVRTVRDAGAPIDAYGYQAHELYGCSESTLKNSITNAQNELKMPMYITEYDIGTENDNDQLNNYKQHIPAMWEADYCAGVTLWGWHYGHTWTNDGQGFSGLIKNGQERPALTWLRDYMQTDKARNAKSPYPNMVKEASVYIKPASIRVSNGVPTEITVNARLKTKRIAYVDLYANNKLVKTLTQEPYIIAYTPDALGKCNLKAVVTATDGSRYERYSTVTVLDGYVPQPGSVPTVGDSYTSISEIGSKPFAIVNEEDKKALFGSGDQNLGYDTYRNAFVSSVAGYYFRLESLKNDADASVRNYYRLRLLTPDLNEYSIWGKPGYLNSQPVDGGWCSFILGLTKGNGEDVKNGAVWDVQYVEDKGFTLKNIATGLYLHDAAPAKYSDPAYFTFCTITYETSAIGEVEAEENGNRAVYDLNGRRVDAGNPAPGLYICNGRKFIIR
ncbi:MAG: endo-1,4-beta-xylanase [Bacteroidales bacterium]|nr:endo-1,4-beta-xylanase [Bacteroidales bacterium]